MKTLKLDTSNAAAVDAVAANENNPFIGSSNETIPPAQAVESDSILKNGFKRAKETILDWEGDIGKAERQLDFLTNGDKHETVYQAFRDTAFFTCDCMDDVNAAAEAFSQRWENAKAKGNVYRQPINMVIAASGVQRECIAANDTLCRWAKCIKALHPLIADGTITRENLISFIRRHGGIRGYSDKLTKQKKTKPPIGVKAMSSADADKKYKDAFNALKASQSAAAGGDDSGDAGRNLVSIVIDISASRTFPNLKTVQRRFNPKDFPDVVSIKTIDETLLELLNEGEDAHA